VSKAGTFGPELDELADLADKVFSHFFCSHTRLKKGHFWGVFWARSGLCGAAS
jgi:hypothetical protein